MTCRDRDRIVSGESRNKKRNARRSAAMASTATS